MRAYVSGDIRRSPLPLEVEEGRGETAAFFLDNHIKGLELRRLLAMLNPVSIFYSLIQTGNHTVGDFP